jgi:NAD(P)H-dependent FMN reductase
MLKVGMIVGSTRPNRFADIPAQWLIEGASARSDPRHTVLDLREYRLPVAFRPTLKRKVGASVSANSTPLSQRSRSTITVPLRF